MRRRKKKQQETTRESYHESRSYISPSKTKDPKTPRSARLHTSGRKENLPSRVALTSIRKLPTSARKRRRPAGEGDLTQVSVTRLTGTLCSLYARACDSASYVIRIMHAVCEQNGPSLISATAGKRATNVDARTDSIMERSSVIQRDSVAKVLFGEADPGQLSFDSPVSGGDNLHSEILEEGFEDIDITGVES